MGDQWQFACAVFPLALYLYALGYWHGGRHPRLVSGVTDHAFLAFGIGGIVLFGPFGQTLVRTFFREANLQAWLTLTSAYLFVAILISRKSSRNLVVYHVDPRSLDAALREALLRVPGNYSRTMQGFEDPETRRGVTVSASSRLRTATITAFGDDPSGLIQELSVPLREQLNVVVLHPSRLAWVLLGASALVLILPTTGWFLSHPHARETLRMLLKPLSGKS